MKITTVEYAKVKSDGNYGSEKIGVIAELADGEKATDVLAKLSKFVNNSLNGVVAKAPVNEDVKETTEVLTNEEEVTEEKPAKKVAKKVAKKAAKKVAKKAVKKVATIAYDRNLKPHKDIFLQVATEIGIRKTFTSTEDNQRAKESLKHTSLTMEGEPMFLNDEVTAEFKERAEAIFFKKFKELQTDV